MAGGVDMGRSEDSQSRAPNGVARTHVEDGVVATVARSQEFFGHRSWAVRNDTVELAVTESGAHMAPVTFYRKDEMPVEPYYIGFSWQGGDVISEEKPEVMRGDFFCLPFGANTTPYNGECHPSHGETARFPWTFVGANSEGSRTSIVLEIEPKARAGRVTRELSIVSGQNVVYDRTSIEGFVGKTTMAHHAILALPRSEGALLVSSSPFVFGMTCPYPFSDSAKGEYQSLAVGAEFDDLRRVPSIFKGAPDSDCSAYPSRRGFTDLLEVWNDPNAEALAWVAAVNTEEGYLWFALKDPAVLPSRVVWVENHGRHQHPWNGRTCCLGLEDGCTFFDKGIAESCSPNEITARGLPTCHELSGKKPFVVTYIQGVVKIPEGFDRVKSADFGVEGVTFVSENGKRAFARVHHAFLYTASLKECQE
jgi:hypothetical protein